MRGNRPRARRDIPLRTKLVLQYAAVITGITVVMAGCFYAYSAAAVQAKNNDFFRSVTQQTVSSLNNLFMGVEDGSRLLRFHESMKGILRRSQEPEYGLAEQITDYHVLSRLLTESIWNENIRSIHLYCNNAAIYTKEGVILHPISDAQGEPWYRPVRELQGVPMWYAGPDGEIFCVCALMDLYSQDGFLGVLRINLDTAQLLRMLQSVNETSQGETALITPGGELVLCSGRDPAFLEEYLAQGTPKAFSEEILSAARHQRKILVSKLSNEWKLVSTVSEEIFEPDRLSLGAAAVGLAAGAMLLGAVFVHFSVKRLTDRIDSMSRFMERVQIHSPDRLREEGSDELTSLQRSFNRMLAAVRESAQATELAIHQKNEADYNILQEQINPHFLYNCLDSINWMALERGSGEISRMARLLGKFYRLSLSGGRQTVSLENEVEHSKIYVEIMQIRFDGQIRVRYQVEEAALALQVPKLILQPLLENAIQHGISCRECQEGTIRVRVFTRDGFLILEVADTGAGMDKEALASLLASLASPQGRTGYGMRNVDRRIRYAFGEGSGLRVRSIAGRGTKVEIRCRLEE